MKNLSFFVRFLAAAMPLLGHAWANAEPPLFQIHAVADGASTNAQIFVLARKNFTESIPVEAPILLEDKDIESAESFIDPDNGPSIRLTLTEPGRARWIDLTTKYTGKRVAQFLHGRLISAPSISQPIRGKTIEISGGFSEPEAAEFCTKLNGRDAK